MLDSDKLSFLKMLQATLALRDKTASTETVSLWWNMLRKYEFCEVEKAFIAFLASKEGRFSPQPSNIIEIIEAMHQDGRPGADEAWAMVPMDEFASAVMTQEMAEALHIARPLLDAGDKIAARMSFKEAYNRIVDANKRSGIKPSWFPSLGQDKEGREVALAEAVRLGRIDAKLAIGLLPPDKIAPMLHSSGNKTLALEYTVLPAEELKARFQAMKLVIGQKR